ncbi:MAG: hypothetical protein ABL984_13080 [Pyrinomonadaceae bacterium]
MSAYGVEVVIEADDEKIFEQVISIARKALVGRVRFGPIGSSSTNAKYVFLTDDQGVVQFDIDGVTSGPVRPDSGFDRFLNSVIRAHVGSLAKSWVFIHAGVVEWKGRAIILPGQSRQGKTTLVSELISCGAGYMSDEYAILDADGKVHPFERDLGVRPSAVEPPVPVDPGEFGGIRSVKPIEAGLVVFTGYVDGGRWQPERMTLGNAILESVPQVIPVSFNTEFVLKVLNTTFNRAIIVKSDRGEARDSAPKILEYFDESIMSGE